MKKILVMLLVALCSTGVADAQLSKLKNLGKKVEKAAKSQGAETAKETVATLKSDLKPYEKRLSDGTIVFVGDDLGMYAKARKTDWNDVQEHCAYSREYWVQATDVTEENGLYYLYRWMKACEEGNTDDMTGEIYTRVNWCIGQIVNINKDKNYNIKVLDFKKFATDYNNTTKKFKEIIWGGMPQNPIAVNERNSTPENAATYAKYSIAGWDWCVDKAEEAKKAGNLTTMQFYLNQAVASREASLCYSYTKGNEAGFADFDAHLKKVLAQTPADFQEANKVLTPAECLAKQAAREEQWAKEEAEKEAARLAEIEKNTDDWPKSNMPELDAQILAIMKAKFPKRKCYRVSVMNNSWNVMMKGLVPERRVVQFWAEFEDKSGRRIAEEHYVCQYYNGKYGKTQYQSQGSRYFWVRQK